MRTLILPRGRRLAVVALAVAVLGLGACQAPGRATARTAAAAAATASTTASTQPGVTRPVTPQAPLTLADRLTTLPAGTRQVVIVYAPTSTSTQATVETYQKTAGAWRAAFPPMPAWIGRNGFTDHPQEGVPATPIGMYGFGATLYGLGRNPGFHYPYHRLVAGDYWNENSDSPAYNTFVHGPNPGGPSEALWLSGKAYTYFAFVTYNVPAMPGKGSGIFLHQSLDKPTAGCVGLPHDDLVSVLTWLDPAEEPRIVMGPTDALTRY